MSKILNSHNFISVNATNTELTSLCSAWSGNSSALIRFLFEYIAFDLVTFYRHKFIFCPCDDVTNVTSYIYFAATERVAWQRIILIINFLS